jgi:hypothetical protein
LSVAKSQDARSTLLGTETPGVYDENAYSDCDNVSVRLTRR